MIDHPTSAHIFDQDVVGMDASADWSGSSVFFTSPVSITSAAGAFTKSEEVMSLTGDFELKTPFSSSPSNSAILVLALSNSAY